MDAVARLSSALADRYRIERELGQGGMATVYLAEDLKHDRKVAVKVLRPELAAVLGAERFVQEIKTTAALQHPHILPLFDSGSADGFLYYVMPYVQGETLRTKLDREHQFAVEESVRIATDVADALDYAHRNGVIHRDIKPENILLHDGRPMVADFGIALAVSAAAGGRMTETGLSLGTPHYMSPEQATAEKEITARSDVYSLASVLYEMLAGQPPHVGGSAQQVIMKIIAEEVPAVTTLRKSVPPNVAAALHQALERLPADRMESAKAFADALRNPAFTTASAALAAPTHARRRSGLMVALAAVALVAVVLAAWGWLRPRPTPGVSRFLLALPPGQEPSALLPPTASPDGASIVYAGPVTDGPGQVQLWVKRRDSYEGTPIPGTAFATGFTFSPDGRSVAFIASGSVQTVALAGGAPVTVVRDSAVGGLGLAWLEDGTIVFPKLSGTIVLARAPATSGAVSEIWRSDGVVPVLPVALPGGAFLFSRCANPQACDLMAYDMRRDTARLVAQGLQRAQYSSSGHLVYFLNGGLAAAPFDVRRLEITGPVLTLPDRASGPTAFSLSRTGTLVSRVGDGTATGNFQLVWVDRSGRQTPVDSAFTFRPTQFAANAGWALSPDGTRLAIGLNTEAGDDIWIKQLPRGPASRITYDAAAEYRPRWTRDGRSVVFASARRVNGVYVRRADGTGSDSLIVAASSVQEAALAPDGSWLLMRTGGSAGAGGRDIVGVRPGTDSVPVPVLATRFDEEAVALSPDGRWLAYQSDETGTTEVFIRPFPDTDHGRWQVSSGGGVAPLWSRDGRELFFLGAAGDMMAARVTAGATLTVGEPTVLFRVPAELHRVETDYYTPWDVARDGRFIMARALDLQGNASSGTIVVVENFPEEIRARARQ